MIATLVPTDAGIARTIRRRQTRNVLPLVSCLVCDRPHGQDVINGNLCSTTCANIHAQRRKAAKS